MRETVFSKCGCALFAGLLFFSLCGHAAPLAASRASSLSKKSAAKPTPRKTPGASPKDEVAATLVRVFSQADAIHREAWWVLSNERRPLSKSPFGKVERAYMTAQNLKLPNKSLFRCDRYLMKRDIKGLKGYPQTGEIFEKCSEKIAAKKIAFVSALREGETQVTFYPENLEEILGQGASFLNRIVECSLKSNSEAVLTELKCRNWAQNRSVEDMIRLDEYVYTKSAKSMIKLRGKVFKNLTETRKIVADVPLEGKIQVVETELYAPEPVKPTPTPTPKVAQPRQTPKVLTDRAAEGYPEEGEQPVDLKNNPPPVATEPAGQVDPDLVRARERYERGETDEVPFVEGMMAAPPPAAPAAGGPAAGGVEGAEQMEQNPQDPGMHAPPEQVIPTNENEGEYHAR